jgi:hypothetical protein
MLACQLKLLVGRVVADIGLVPSGRWLCCCGRFFAGIDQFFYWLCYQCKLLPIYALATRICPPGMEATMIAMVLSLKDLGYTVATYYGAAITAAAGITENECGATPFDNLWHLYVWRIVCRLMPVMMIGLIPTEVEISQAMAALVASQRAPPSTTDAAARVQESAGLQPAAAAASELPPPTSSHQAAVSDNPLAYQQDRSEGSARRRVTSASAIGLTEDDTL